MKTKTKSNQSNDKLFITGINTTDKIKTIKVYPNPSTGILNIDLNGLEKMETEVIIQNILGETVYETRAMNQHLVINTGSISGGIYMVNIKKIVIGQ
jgi:hypothetical protein